MVSFRGQQKLGPRPDRSPLGVYFKIFDEHPHPFDMQSPPPPPGLYVFVSFFGPDRAQCPIVFLSF